MAEKRNNAYYYEISMLKMLEHMGYLDKKAVLAVADIAAEAYGADLIMTNLK